MTVWQISLDDPLAWQIYGDDPTDYVVEVGAANLGLYAKLASPAFTGTPTGPTAAPATNTTQLATCAFVLANAGGGASVSDTAFGGSWDGVTIIAPSKNAVYDKIAALEAGLGAYALLASPAFTGNPTAPTPSPGDNDLSIATTAFVSAAITALSLSSYATLASPVFTGNPTAPTATPGDNDFSIANTAFVSAAISTAVSASVSDAVFAAAWNSATTVAPSKKAVYLAITPGAINIGAENGANATHRLVTYARYPFTIDSLQAVQTTSGTITLAVQINGTSVTGLGAVAITSTPQNVTATAANAVAIGDKVTLVYSSNAAAVDVRGALLTTRTG
jgi:predicted nucleic acid-binding protein